MIGRLRKRFIRIAMLSVTLVMLLLSLIVNILLSLMQRRLSR